MKKALPSVALLLALGTSVFAQSLVVDYHFDTDLQDHSSSQNHLHAYGSGAPYHFVPLGSTNVSSDTCVAFNAGMGLESHHAIYNATWQGTAVSFWIQSNGFGAISTTGFIIQGAYAGFGVRMSNGKFVPFFGGTSVGVPHSNFTFSHMNLGWHHVVAQNDGDSTSLYIDGNLDFRTAEMGFAMTAPDTNAKLYIGTAVAGGYNLEDFSIDEMKVYDHALTHAQIQTLLLHQDITVGVEDAGQRPVALYPNPTLGAVQLRLASGAATVHVLNAQGQCLATQRITQQPSATITLPPAAGIYFLRIEEVNGGQHTHRVVRQ